MQARREWQDIFKILKGIICNLEYSNKQDYHLKKQGNHKSTTNPKHTIDSRKPKIRKHKHKIKGNQKATKRKTKRKKRNKEETQNQLENKVSNGNKYISINNYLKYEWTKHSNQKI